ncbi:MAG: Glycosyl transferase group 1 [Candidatus Gottesmanbacteria bacterium GW2011_GWA2_47_9]|uniref:Glycosyl transferase group 1 n=2 Tax=Microgenomates group TaxID=1794810 RepID=A0A0G1U3C7_9BACT|nr:MAG: Glycosyl transferase group 1 [Candidatus Gottesmanbacteria bacterium GW2011_GWA2_47_9]
MRPHTDYKYMIIVIDGYEANISNRVGIGRYAYEMLRHIYDDIKNQKSKIKNTDQKLKILDAIFRIYLPNPPLSDMPKETVWWQYRVIGPKPLWTFIGLPLALWRDKPECDVVFSPTHYVPRFINIPRVMAIMDVSYLAYPQLFRAKDLHQLTQWTRYSVRRAARILTISQFSKDGIIKAYGIPSERVMVTYPGMTTISNIKDSREAGSRSARQTSNVVQKYVLPSRYILSVGTLQPRKNYGRLIEAFSMLIRTVLSKGQSLNDLQLVIVGKKGWLYEEILKAPEQFGVSDRVKFLEFVPDEDLQVLYEKAAAFALPSLYEGFGLPVLEAMARGCPVVVSNVSSLPEIAGDAGIYIDPEDVTSIAKGLETALEETKEERKRRVEAGLHQAAKFTWEKAAQQTLAILEEVGGKKP